MEGCWEGEWKGVGRVNGRVKNWKMSIKTKQNLSRNFKLLRKMRAISFSVCTFFGYFHGLEISVKSAYFLYSYAKTEI
jgi:hypothetical protein